MTSHLEQSEEEGLSIMGRRVHLYGRVLIHKPSRNREFTLLGSVLYSTTMTQVKTDRRHGLSPMDLGFPDREFPVVSPVFSGWAVVFAMHT